MMTKKPQKMSEIMKEMAERLLRHPDKTPSSEAVHVALLFANIAWNESVGMNGARANYRKIWAKIEDENPALWNELKSNDIDAMIDELVQYKKSHYPDDQRRILMCGMALGKVHVEWLDPAAPGVDPKWEVELYSLVRTGEWQKAVRFLRKSQRMSRNEATSRVAMIAASLQVQQPRLLPLKPSGR